MVLYLLSALIQVVLQESHNVGFQLSGIVSTMIGPGELFLWMMSVLGVTFNALTAKPIDFFFFGGGTHPTKPKDTT